MSQEMLRCLENMVEAGQVRTSSPSPTQGPVNHYYGNTDDALLGFGEF
jgi:hypothetical protein